MYEFNYHRPPSLADAKKLLEQNAEAKLLAGGMTLLPTMKMRLASPSDLVDLASIEGLAAISESADAIEVGAMVRHAEVAGSDAVRAAIPALAELAESIGDAQVRNRGTLGGSVVNSDPAADYPAAILGLNAVIKTDSREIAADDYFKGLFETALEPGEIVLSVRFPKPVRAAYSKFPNPASRYAVVGGRTVRRYSRRSDWCCCLRISCDRDGGRSGQRVFGERAGRHCYRCGRSQQRFARQRRVPGAPGRGHGKTCRPAARWLKIG